MSIQLKQYSQGYETVRVVQKKNARITKNIIDEVYKKILRSNNITLFRRNCSLG